MNYFAQIVNNIVTQVTCVNADITDGAQFCHDLLGGDWVQTFINDPEKTYAGIGYTYNPVADVFIAPRPFASWTLDNNYDWQAPKPKPDGSYYWDEDLKDWIKIDEA